MKPHLQIPNPQPGEDLVFVLRRHSFTFLARLTPFVFLFAMPLLAAIFFWQPLQAALLAGESAGILIATAASAYFLFLGLQLLHVWMLYYLDVWMVTTKRIVSVTQQSLFSRVVSELPIEKIQDVTVEVHGPTATFLHFGDVHIQTAGETPRFLFDDVPQPNDVCRRILALHERVMQERSGAQFGRIPSPEASGKSADTL